MTATAAFVGVGSSPIARVSDDDIGALAAQAALAAIIDAGLDVEEIDGYVGAPSATTSGSLHVDGADEVSMQLLARQLGLRHLSWGIDLHRGFATEMAAAAAHALAADECRYVLGVRALYRLPDVPYASTATDRAAGEQQWTAPYGYGATGARFAIRLRRYFEQHGAGRDDLYAVVDLARRHAAGNPLAVWRDRTVTREEYLASRLIADPLCLFDCDLPVCGAAAFVMTTPARADAGPHRPVYLRGSAGAQQPARIFERSAVHRDQVDAAQLYDGFASMVWDALESLGFCAPGTAWTFVRDGACALTGALPVNTFGGSLGEGRLHGMGHLREAVLQVSGRAGARQVPGLRNCLVQVGPFDHSSVVMLGVDPA